MPKLTGKVALVTGAAAGQGAAFAAALARDGAAVMLTDIDPNGRSVARRLEEAGGRAAFLAHDAADERGWIAAVAATVEAFGGLHILVNNAGTIARQGII